MSASVYDTNDPELQSWVPAADDVVGDFPIQNLPFARPDQAGSLLELTAGGNKPLRLATGEIRTFLQDGNTIVLTAFCQSAGSRRIGFGECRGIVVAVRQ